MEIAQNHNIDDLRGKKIVILGAGPVAQIAAILSAKLNCKTYLVETWDKSNKKIIEELANKLTEQAGNDSTIIQGKFAIAEEEKLNIINDADIIWSLAAAGVQVLSKMIMSNLKNKIVCDINLVPPYGIDGLKPKDSNKQIYPSIYGTGALAIGRLKSKVEEAILKEASTSTGKKIYDYRYAFKKAKKILFGSEIKISN